MRTNLVVSTASFAVSLLLLAASSTSRAQNLFVANSGNNTIDEINSTGTVTVFASSDIDGPSTGGLAFDSSGNLYVSNYAGGNNDGSGYIEEFNSSGVGTTFASGLNAPQGLAFNTAGNLYLAFTTSTNTYIEEFSSSGVGTTFASSSNRNGSLSAPIGLAFDQNGNLYVANQGNSTIEEFNTNGVGTVFAAMPSPTGLAFDTNRNLYVANVGPGNVVTASSGTIEEFTLSGGVLSSNGTVFASGLDNPQSLAFDTNGNLYVSNYGNNTIEEFNTNGVGTVFASGLDEPTGLAIQPVPEPSTWALLAVGLIAVLPLSRRRASTAPAYR